MHVSAVFPLLWAASTQALSINIPGNLALEKRLSDEEICGLKYETGDLSDAAKTWVESGADAFLMNWLVKKGVEEWETKIIQSTVGAGEGGSSLDCQNFPAGNTCNPPQPGTCSRYDPPAVYFIQISMANCFSMFLRMHEAIQDYVLEQLTSGIKSVVDDFARPEPNSQVVTLLISAFVTAASFTGPVWQAAAPLGFGVGVLNGVASQINNDPPELDANDDLENQLGKVFKPAQDGIAAAVNDIFTGYPVMTAVAGDLVSGSEVWAVFSDGKFLDSNIVNESTDKWKKAVAHQTTQGLVVAALQHDGWIVFVDTSKGNKGDCDDVSGAQWIDNECYMLAKRSDVGTGSPFTRPEDTIDIQNGEMVKKLTDSEYPYQFDLNEFFTNAKDCNGGDRDISVPSFDTKNKLPKCFVNLEVKKASVSPFYPGLGGR